jgi:hypothetical protein
MEAVALVSFTPTNFLQSALDASLSIDFYRKAIELMIKIS